MSRRAAAAMATGGRPYPDPKPLTPTLTTRTLLLFLTHASSKFTSIAAAAGFIGLAGDGICQKLERKWRPEIAGGDHDWARGWAAAAAVLSVETTHCRSLAARG